MREPQNGMDGGPPPNGGPAPAPASAVTAVEWQIHEGPHVVLRAPAGSYAATRAEAEYQDAEKLSATLAELLSPATETATQPVQIFLVDAVVDSVSQSPSASLPPAARTGVAGQPPSDPPGAPPNPGDAVLVRTVQPDAQLESLPLSLTRVLLARWFGPNAAVSPFCEGVAGVVAARCGLDTSLETINEQLQAMVNSGMPFSLFQPPAPPPGTPPGSPPSPGTPPQAPYQVPGAGPSHPQGGPAPTRSAAQSQSQSMSGAPPASAMPANGAPPSGGPSQSSGPPPGGSPQGGSPQGGGSMSQGGGPMPAPGGGAPGAMGGMPSTALLATSFVAFLLRKYGEKELPRLFTVLGAASAPTGLAMTPDPTALEAARTAATRTAYGKTPGELEALWIEALRTGPSALQSLRDFGIRMLPMLRPYTGRLVVSLLATSAASLCSQAPSRAVNVLSQHRELAIPIFGILLLIYIAGAAFTLLSARLSNEINYNVLNDWQGQLFAHLQKLSHSYYTRRDVRVGDIVSRLSRDLMVVQQALTQSSMAIAQVLQFIFSVINLFLINSSVCIALLIVVVPAMLALQNALRSRLQESSMALGKSSGDVSATASESLSAYAVIKAYGMEKRVEDDYRKQLGYQRGAGIRLGSVMALFQSGTLLSIGLGQILALFILVRMGRTGEEFASVLLVLMPMLGPVVSISGMLQSIQTAPGSVERINQLLNEPVDIDDKPDAVALPLLGENDEIRLENVSFGYDSKPILRNVSLTIPAGKSVAVVGGSGSGKSTVVNLILRFWDPNAGRVLVAGRDLRDATVASLRSQIGIVLQDTFIFNGSVRDNIAIGLSGLVDPASITDEQIVSAARGAYLDDYVRALPEGYNTMLGERGAQMSGGQRQRLAIARAILRNPRILVLDEATSALDASVERAIGETLEELSRGRTTISITHRLASAARADLIFVMHEGQLVEQGTHQELMAKEGHYRRLYEDQVGTGRERTRRESVGVERLRGVPLFASLDDATLKTMADHLSTERYAPGEVVVQQGEPGDKLYIVGQGGAETMFNDGTNSHRVNVLRPGDYFGEMSLLADAPRSATVQTTGATELFGLAQEDFRALLERQPAIRQAVESTVAQRRAVLQAALGGGGSGNGTPPQPASAPQPAG